MYQLQPIVKEHPTSLSASDVQMNGVHDDEFDGDFCNESSLEFSGTLYVVKLDSNVCDETVSWIIKLVTKARNLGGAELQVRIVTIKHHGSSAKVKYMPISITVCLAALTVTCLTNQTSGSWSCFPVDCSAVSQYKERVTAECSRLFV